MAAVLVLGGYGLIGSAIVERLRLEGREVIGLGRNTARARRRWPDVVWREADLGRLQTAAAWAPLLQGVDVVVNAAGVLQQGLGDDLAAVQTRALEALAAAAPAAGLRRIVQVSAVGVEPKASTAFLRTKAAGDAAVLACGVEAVVLRPGLVIAQRAYGGTALLRALAAFPSVMPLVHSESRIQTASVQDVAEVAAAAVRGEIPAGTCMDLVEPEARSLAETVSMLRGWLGLSAAPVLRAPPALAALVATAADVLGFLGWRSPLRSTAMRVLREGVTGDPDAVQAWRGRPLRSLPETLASLSAGSQEVWFARLWLLKGPIFSVLAGFWIVSGVVGLWRSDAAAAVLTAHGASSDFATAAVFAGAFVDIALGLGVMLRPWAAIALKGMVAVSLAYLAGASSLAPDLWLDPLGPLVKVVPAVFLALVGLALLDER